MVCEKIDRRLTQKRKLILDLMIIMLMIIILKVCSISVMASDNIVNFYGDVSNSYRQYNSSGYKVYTYPVGTIIFVFDLWNEQYIAICCPVNELVNDGSNKWGLYRQIASFDNSGKLTNNLYGQFFQMEGYSSDNYYTYDGVEYIIRTMTITEYLEGLPYFFVWSNRTDGPQQILKQVLDGYKKYTSEVNIENVNASIDTSAIEQLVSDNNIIASSTDTTVKAIETSLNSGFVGGEGLSDEDRNLFKRFDTWLIIIMFAVCVSMFRQVLHQVGRNIRGR